VRSLTGSVRGGVTALGCKKACSVLVYEEIILYDLITISARLRDTQIVLAPDDYLQATGAAGGQICRGK